MKNLMLFLFLALPLSSFAAVYEVGDRPADMCWEEVQIKRKICLKHISKVNDATVLIYNAGWCGPCNTEFRSLVPLSDEFVKRGEKVQYVSLSAEGWKHGSAPDDKFLGEWGAKHGMFASKAWWFVAASPRDSGRQFFASPSIPNVVILNKDGEITYKGIAPAPRTVLAKVREALSKP